METFLPVNNLKLIIKSWRKGLLSLKQVFKKFWPNSVTATLVEKRMAKSSIGRGVRATYDSFHIRTCR